MTKPFLISGSTFLRMCTKRPSVETKATENPVRLCVLCFLGLCADVAAVSGLSATKSSSTWPNMACSRPRLDWSPLREATGEPSSSEPWEPHFLALLVWLPIQSVQHIKEEQHWFSDMISSSNRVFHFGENPSLADITWRALRRIRIKNLRNQDWCFLSEQPRWHWELKWH